MIKCRCAVLNNITGDAASDYARQHLDETRSDGQGRVYYRCPDTGIGWMQERMPQSRYGEAQCRLRRTDRV